MLLIEQVADIDGQVGILGELVAEGCIEERGRTALGRIGGVKVVGADITGAKANTHVLAWQGIVAPQRRRMFGCRSKLVPFSGCIAVAHHFRLHIGVTTR